MHEVVILMAWHHEHELGKIHAFEMNRRTFLEQNPDVPIIIVMNQFENIDQAWLSTDLSVFHWFKQYGADLPAKRYVIVEWDCWADCSVFEYFQKVWDCDVVVPSIKYPERDDWTWFSTIPKLPVHAQEYAVGVTPFCGILVSAQAMQAISNEILQQQYNGIMSELRFGTIATMFNYDPVVNPTYTRSLCWKEPVRFDRKYKGLHHPRKAVNVDQSN